MANGMDEFWSKIESGYYNTHKDEFRPDIQQAFDVNEHPKRDHLFSLAWGFGHSSGYHEIAYYYRDLVDLVR